MNVFYFIIGFITVPAKAEFTIDKYCNELSTVCDGSVGTSTFVQQLADRSITMIEGLIGAVAVVAVIWGGFLLATSGANEENRNKGKSVITAAIVGIVLAIVSAEIVRFVFTLVAEAVT